MLRRRIKKLERLLPLGTADLMNRWERQAMAALTGEDQALVRASFESPQAWFLLRARLKASWMRSNKRHWPQCHVPPMGTGDLMDWWERDAMASVCIKDQCLVRASFEKMGHRSESDTGAETAATQRYRDALAAALMDVSDADLDRMIESFGSIASLAEVIA